MFGEFHFRPLLQRSPINHHLENMKLLWNATVCSAVSVKCPGGGVPLAGGADGRAVADPRHPGDALLLARPAPPCHQHTTHTTIKCGL